jgi:acyl carrier protein
MTAIKDRVLDCFCAVFPNYSRDELLTATRESISEWDSLAGITILTVIQQEFHLDIDLGELEHFNSVETVTKYVLVHSTITGGSNDN